METMKSAGTGSARKRLLSVLGIYGLVVGVSILLYALGSFDSWQEKLFDRLYTREEPTHPIVIIAIDDESLNEIGQWPWPRELFGRALKNIPNAAVIGMDISFSEPSRAGLDDDRTFADALREVGSTTRIVLPLQLAAHGKLSAEPLPLFAAYTHEGFVNLPVDQDAVARRTTLSRDGYPSFPSLLSADAFPESVGFTPAEFRIRYHGPQGTFLTIPFVDLLEGRVPASALKGSIVLIGATASDLHDTVQTPFGLMSGVEAHANAIETIAVGSFPRPMLPWMSAAFIALANLLVLFLVMRLKRFSFLIPALAGLVLALNLAGFLLFSYNILYPILYLNLSLLIVTVLAIAFQYLTESREKRFIRNIFQYYLTPEVVDELIEHPEKLTLGGERKEMTILFSDIRDFTAISERLSPHDLTRIMNEYLTAMTDVIMENKGVVDKYIGDAIMAFWGAPLENPEQARDACRAAAHMSERLAELNAGWKREGSPELAIRVGIAMGPVIVGNMGSLKRFNYTVMGDEVNFASRLEGLNKAYGTECIVSESTKSSAASSGLLFRELDLVRVKGKREPRKIFELVTETRDDALKQHFSHFDAGLEAYRTGDWDSAIVHFTRVLEARPHDGPSRELLRRSNEFKADQPKDWDGAYTFQTK
ncbi:MAG: adenylate cyclase [Candidatus Parcubacteria bacterium]|jgi:adenylate cyclase|nr:adenylate cyclase [Candidatus Parcubacteria bacterium]